jgi:hypothetical protein
MKTRYNSSILNPLPNHISEMNNLWPFRKRAQDYRSRADQMAEFLVRFSQEATNVVLEGLLGKDALDNAVPARAEELIASLAIELLVFALHLVDRLTFSVIGSANRELFMDELCAATERLTKSPFDDRLRRLYNTRQEFYSHFTQLVAINEESLRGTLFWEFGKMLASTYAESNPEAVFMTSANGMNLYEAIADALREVKVIP